MGALARAPLLAIAGAQQWGRSMISLRSAMFGALGVLAACQTTGAPSSPLPAVQAFDPTLAAAPERSQAPGAVAAIYRNGCVVEMFAWGGGDCGGGGAADTRLRTRRGGCTAARACMTSSRTSSASNSCARTSRRTAATCATSIATRRATRPRTSPWGGGMGRSIGCATRKSSFPCVGRVFAASLADGNAGMRGRL